MGVFSFLSSSPSPSPKRNHPFPDPSSSSSSSAAYPPQSSSSATAHAPSDNDYDDVALGSAGGPNRDGQGGANARQSFSAHRTTDGAFVGGSSGGAGGGYSVESSYPPLPTFSRHQHTYSHSSTSGPPSARYPSLPKIFHRLEQLLDAQSPVLYDSLSPPLSYGRRDEALLSLQSAIAPYVLPPPVVESYLLHDGQDALALGSSAAGGTGLFYGLWWLPLERVEEEWTFWRKLEQAGGLVGSGVGGDAFSAQATGGRVRGRAHPYRPEEGGRAEQQEVEEGELEGMSAFPPGWVRAKYSHPGWLPLLSDRCGNYIGVDLDPPPPPPSSSPSSSRPGTPSTSSANPASGGYGQPGQVIAFGREIDEKVVLFPGDGPGGWARFLAAFVEDVERGEFARLGEKPALEGAFSSWGGGGGAASDEEAASGGERRMRREGSSEGEEEGEWNRQEDGLGDRGYFEEGVYGEEVVEEGSLGGNGRGARTWVLRAPYRRLLATSPHLESTSLIPLLCERSRLKWRSLGVGTRSNVANGRSPLSVFIPPGLANGGANEFRRASTATGVGADGGEEDLQGAEDPKSASTMTAQAFSEQQQQNEEDPEHPLGDNASSPLGITESSAAEANASTVELVLSPPSPTRAGANGGGLNNARHRPPPLVAVGSSHSSNSHQSYASAPSSRRSSHESNRSNHSAGGGYLQQPPRRASGSGSNGGGASAKPRQRRPPPPPAAPFDLPTFAQLDFNSDTAYSSSSLDSRDRLHSEAAAYNDERVSTSPRLGSNNNGGSASPPSLMQRLSFQGSSPTPTRETLLPTSISSRPTSISSVSSLASSTHTSPYSPPIALPHPLGDPPHSTIPIGISHSREPTGEDEGEDVPLHAGQQSTATLIGSPILGEAVRVVVGGEGDGEKERSKSPGDESYR